MQWFEGDVDCSAEQAQFDERAIGRLQQFFERQVTNGIVQGGGYLLARHGKRFAHATCGVVDNVDEERPYTVDSLHSLASLTKPITAVAILQLVEQGLLGLEEPVHHFISEMDNAVHRPITVWHLLTHTSGLRPMGGALGSPYPLSDWADQLTAETWLPFVLRGQLQAAVGTEWNYSSHGFKLLGELVSRVSGKPYEQFVKSHIFEPLGMNNSFFELPPEQRERVCIIDDWGRNKVFGERSADYVSAWSADGGVYSTMNDLWRFAEMIRNGGSVGDVRILGRKTVKTMTRNHLHNIPTRNWGIPLTDKRYGLGVEMDKDPHASPETITHEGYGWSSLVIDPAEQLLIILFMGGAADWWKVAPMKARAIVYGGIN